MKKSRRLIIILICMSLAYSVQAQLTLSEKETRANQLMDEINDYVNEVNDKGYPDDTINRLYKQAQEDYKNFKDEFSLAELGELSVQIKKRKDNILEINRFIEQVNKNVEKYANNKRLNTSQYETTRIEISRLLLKREYTLAYSLALTIETDMELTVLDYIFESEVEVDKLKSSNFSTIYFEDLLLSMKNAFSGAKTEGISLKIKGQEDSFKKDYAQGLVKNIENKKNNLKFVDYSLILQNTEEVIFKKEQVYSIKSRMDKLKSKIDEYSAQDIDTSKTSAIFEEAIVAFNEENLDKADVLLIEGENGLDAEKAKLNITQLIARESVGLLKKHWKSITIGLATVFLLSYIIYKKEKVNRLKRRLQRLKIEKDAIIDLIKESQKERFIKKTLAESHYRIKMEKYDERLNEVKKDIKTIETVLINLARGKDKQKDEDKNDKNKRKVN
ncbi:MAG: hypothetical protein ABIB47_05990 [Candidatus Woesearchaeota archaeon]